MSKAVARTTDGWFANLSPEVVLVLVYGPDGGKVSEVVRTLIADSGVDRDDPFAFSALSSEGVKSDPSVLSDALATLPFGSARRLVHVGLWEGASARVLEGAIGGAARGNLAIIEGGDLRPNVAARRFAEGNARSLSLACYRDDDSALRVLVREELAHSGLEADGEVREAIVALLGEDREGSRQELEKLVLFKGTQKVVSLDDVSEAMDNGRVIHMDQLVDDIALGRRSEALTGLVRLSQRGTDPGAVTGALLRHFSLLARLRCEADSNRSLDSAFRSLQPPLFFRRRAKVEHALTRWSQRALKNGIRLLSRAQGRIRANPKAGYILCERCIIFLTSAR